MNATAVRQARTVIVGAAGRMGSQLLRLITEFPALQLHGAVDREGSAALGRDAGAYAGREPIGIPITASLAPLLETADLVIDFSHPESAATNVAACVKGKAALLMGTTGLSPDLESALADAGRSIALLVAANTSLGVNVLLELVRRTAEALPPSYDIEIIEAHHRSKLDSPSGTALALGKAAAAARGLNLREHAAYRPPGVGPARAERQIGMSSVRGGDVVGEHEVWFLGPGERVLLKHSATDRAVFARGALTAGAWLAGRAPGRYTMSDVLSS
jgi:4-hydroxy-tetrahydrodipicolinate reductase